MGKEHYVEKVLTGIEGLDDITYGGLPKYRATLVSGYAGCGKTVLAMQFILNGIIQHDEPGVFISMEETETDLRNNMASFGYDIGKLENENKIYIENVKIGHTDLFGSGNFDMSALLIRIELAIKSVNAKRIVIDTPEMIFNDIQDENIFRREFLRMINWLKERGLTAVFTAGRKENQLTKTGIEEFVTDCVILLKHIKVDNVYTRRLHILKYRGSKHGTNEYPFLIDHKGISLLPITIPYEKDIISNEILSTGIEGLDEQINKKGIYKGSTLLISGTSGTGKTTLAVSFCMSALKNNLRCLFFAFEETNSQLQRNMFSVGFDFKKYEKTGALKIAAERPTLFGLETHLVKLHKYIEEFNPDVVILDPITNLIQVGTI
ncbi:MAG: circadian clock protein KaiC, partial [Bacteroidota bacterium]